MRFNYFSLLFLVSLTFAACKKDNPSQSGGDGTLHVYLTDDPADYDQVNIDVQSVEVHTNADGWITLTSYPGIYNLLDLTNGIDTLIASSAVPAGNISQVRLNLGDDNTIMVDSVIYPLDVPSGNTSGLKINIHQTVVPGGDYTLLLDFDAGHSIVEEGNGEYKLKPVIHGQFISTVVTDGTLTGVVMPPASNAFVSATNASDSSSTYINPLTGQFLLQNLTPGTYSIFIDTNLPYNDTTFSVNIAVGTNVVDTVWVD